MIGGWAATNTLRGMFPSMEGHEDNCPCSVGRAHAALSLVEAALDAAEALDGCANDESGPYVLVRLDELHALAAALRAVRDGT